MSPPPSSSSSARSSDPLAGTRYRSVGILGRGGMGEILDAEHRELGRKVAVKMLHRHLVTPDAMERFRIEAEALARLSDPHLVVVTDCGETPLGIPYFVMERLSGGTLRQELSRRRVLPLREATDLFLEVLAGLSVLHREGIVHRDLKPGNVFVCDGRDGARTVKLLDLGIAKILVGAPSSIGLRAPSQPLTQGMTIGTPQYMAPEQARGGAIDARADIYAAGLLFFKMITGKNPFEECRDFASLCAAQETPIPPPSSMVEHPFPPGVDALVLRALAFDPDERFASVVELRDALRAATSATRVDFVPSEEEWFGCATTAALEEPAHTTPADRLAAAAPAAVIASVRAPDPNPPIGSAWPRLLLTAVGAASLSALFTLALLLLLAAR